MRRLIALAVGTAAIVVGGAVSATDAQSGAVTKVVYHSKLRNGNNEIFVVSSAGGPSTRLTRNPWSDSNPTWSPGRRLVAFESNRAGNRHSYEDSDIFVMKADGSGVRELTFSNAFDGDPSWSSLDEIAFESERTHDSEIWKIDSTGGNEKQLTNNRGFDGDPAWSPDGTRIAFTSARDNGDREIYVMNSDGSGQTRLTSSPGFDENPSWSPDGRWIAFDSMRDGNLEVYVMKADGTKLARVTNHPALDAIPSWSPDSKRIVFVSERISKGQRRLFVANRDGANVRMLSRGAFDMSPDWAG
jgi:dipeptidyl aminopeptidase/acylaminoacyl peptidase